MAVIFTTSAAVFECKSKACAPPPVGTGGSTGGGGGKSSPSGRPSASKPRRFGQMHVPGKTASQTAFTKFLRTAKEKAQGKTSDLVYRPEKDRKEMHDGVYRGGPHTAKDIQWL